MDLLERESHLAALARAFAEAREGNARIALVSGEAGIGKTSLVRRFAAEITPPTRLLWGACDALFTPRPLGPLYDIAPQVGPPLLDQLNKRQRLAGEVALQHGVECFTPKTITEKKLAN
jgi:predicted ATPase